MIERDEIDRLIAAVPENVIIVLDSPSMPNMFRRMKRAIPAAREYVERHDNVVMLRTFSKIFGLGSLRWARAISLHILAVLASIRGPFSVNAAAATAGRAAVLDKDFIATAYAITTWSAGQESIRQAGFDALPTAANFFLIRFADAAEASTAHDFLRQRGILLRSMVRHGLSDCLRMSIGDEEEMEITATAFKDLAASLENLQEPGHDPVAVVGAGLIGSSLLRVVAESELAGETCLYDKDADVRHRAAGLGLADSITDNALEAVKGADLVVLAIPVGAMAMAAADIAPGLASGLL